MSDKPRWLRGHPLLTPAQISRDRRRVPPARAVGAGRRRPDRQDRGERCSATGVAGNTYIVFSSDNGFHMGDHRLMPGKHDRVRHGHPACRSSSPARSVGREPRRARITENVDLCPTFGRLGRRGSRLPSTGAASSRSCTETPRANWRHAALIEHHGPDFGVAAGPDAPPPGSGNPLTYEALRLPHCHLRRVHGRRARVLQPH